MNNPTTTTATTRVPLPPRRLMTRILLPTTIFVLFMGMLVAASWNALQPRQDVQVVPVVVRTAMTQPTTTHNQSEHATPSITVQAPGWLEPDPHPTYIAALEDGIVEDVLVLEGERVQAGQVVVRLVDDEARINVSRSEASLMLASSRVTAAVAERDAARVDLDTLLEQKKTFAIARANVAKAEASIVQLGKRLDAATLRIDGLKDDLARKTALLEDDIVAEGVVIGLRFDLDAATADRDAVEAERAVAIATLDAMHATLEAAQQDLELLIEPRRRLALATAMVEESKARLLSAEADLEDARLRFDRMNIVSPVDGVVMKRLVVPGSKLAFGGDLHARHVMHVYDPQHMQVRADVPIVDAGSVRIGMTAEVIVDVLPDTVFHGVVTRIVHEADLAKNTVEVKVAIENPTDELKPEMLARVKLRSGSGHSSSSSGDASSSSRHRLYVPQHALLDADDEKARAVIVANRRGSNGQLAITDVQLGPATDDGWIEVRSGLNAGDLLVINDAATFDTGDHVRITTAMKGGS